MTAAVLPWLLSSSSGCALFTLAATKRSHPPLDGMVAAAGARGEITIHRDAAGVPHIEAANEDDAWYGLGYVHAQDRLFQLDVRRRLAHGEISELLGDRAVDLDAFVRAMELERRGQEAIDRAQPAAQARITAYTEGLNAGVASLKTLPVEYRLLGVDFAPFDAADTTGMLYLMGWSLQENLDHELAAMAFAHLPADELDSLFQTYPDTPPIDPFWDDLRTRDLGELTAGFEAFTGALGGRPKGKGNPEASNNWVVGGSRTASGKPIVANDPHLVQSVPSIWYAAHLRGGDLHVAGATLPGVPGLPIGHNEEVAWGLTNVMADTVDLAVLERDGDDAVIVRGQAEPLQAHTYTLRPRDAEPVERTVYTTSLGPVVNEGGDAVLVMRWAGLVIEDQTPDVLTTFVHSTSVAQLLDDLDPLPSVAPQNMVMADTGGDIAWKVVGSIPRRHGFTGRVPHPASDGDRHWDGMLDARPQLHNPERDYLATANHKPDPDAQPSVDAIATAYLPPHRYDRIMDRLGELPQATPADMHELHTDVRENAAATYLPELLTGEPSAEAAPCHALLSGWADRDYQATIDSPEAAAWAMFQEELFRATFASRLDDDQMHLLLDLMSTGRNPLDGDFDRFLDEAPQAVDTALRAACRRLSERFGAPEEARWGELHPVKLAHPFSEQSSLLAGWDMVSAPFPGTGASVAAADYEWTEDEWKVGFMASMRIVMPLDDLGASTFVHPGGQSGQPRSPYYRSHYDEFVGGQTLPLYFDADDVQANAVHTLTLTP